MSTTTLKNRLASKTTEVEANNLFSSWWAAEILSTDCPQS